MPFNIQEFTSQHNRNNGYLKSRSGRVSITAPPGLSSEFDRQMEFYIQDFTLPGYQLNFGNVHRYGYGPATQRPFGPNTNPVTLLLLADGNAETLSFWNDWLDLIIPHNTDPDKMNMAIRSTSTGDFMYLVSYKDQYETDVKLDIFDDYGDISAKYSLRQAYPSEVSPINMSWGAMNDIVQFQVTMQYTDWQRHEIIKTL